MRSSESRQSSRRASKGRKQGDSPFQIAVHDGEEHLEEEVDGVDQHRQQVEPGLAGHDGHEIDSSRGLGELYLNGEQSRSKRGCWRCRGVRIAEFGIGDGFLWGSALREDGGITESEGDDEGESSLTNQKQ